MLHHGEHGHNAKESIRKRQLCVLVQITIMPVNIAGNFTLWINAIEGKLFAEEGV